MGEERGAFGMVDDGVDPPAVLSPEVDRAQSPQLEHGVSPSRARADVESETATGKR